MTGTIPGPIPDIGARTLIMGVVNVTPDSFSDGGDFFDADTAIRHGQALAAEGADILDIGGESTRPGHKPIDEAEEQARVLPVIRALVPTVQVPISIDTYRASTARLALAAGASIVNDVWGLQRDPGMADLVAETGVSAILMHNREAADPGLDIVTDVLRFLDHSVALARKAGVKDSQIVLDPGIGFGKTREQSFEVLRRLAELKALGFPLLVGASRKAFLTLFYGDSVPPKQRLFGTLAAHLFAVGEGAAIVRVHDVRPHVEALRVADGLKRDGLNKRRQ